MKIAVVGTYLSPREREEWYRTIKPVDDKGKGEKPGGNKSDSGSRRS